MAMGYRDVYILLRARDEASRTLQRMGGNVGRLGKEIIQANENLAKATERSTRAAAKSQENYVNNVAKSNTRMKNEINALNAAHQQYARNVTRLNENARIRPATEALTRNRTELQANSTAIHANRLAISQLNSEISNITRQLSNNSNAVRANKSENAGLATLGKEQVKGLQNQRAALRQVRDQMTSANDVLGLRNRMLRQDNEAIQQNISRWRAMAADRIDANKRMTDSAVAASRAEADARSRNYAAQRAAGLAWAKQNKEQYAEELRLLQEKQKALQATAQRVTAFGQASLAAGLVITGIGAKGVQAFSSMAKSALEFDLAARQTSTQLDTVEASLDQLKNAARNVGREIGAPFEELQPTLYSIFSSMSVGMADAERLLAGFAREAVAGQTEVKAVMRSSVAMMNAFGLGASDLTRIQDMQFQTVRKGILTYEELSNVIGRLIPSAARSGQSIETMGAMLGFLTRQGLNARMAATSAARALETISSPGTVEKLRGMGITVKDVHGEFLPLVDIVNQLSNLLNGMPGPERTAVMHELLRGSGSSNIQARRFWETVILNVEEFNQQVEWANNNAGAFANAYGRMSEAPAVQLQILSNSWAALRTELGEQVIPVIIDVGNRLLSLLEAIRDMDPVVRERILQFFMLASAAAVIVGPLLTLGGLFALIAGQLGLVTGGMGSAIKIMLGGPAAILGVVGALMLLYVYWDEVVAAIDRFVQRWRDLGPVMQAVVVATGAALATVLALGVGFLKGATGLTALTTGLRTLFTFLSFGHPVLMAVTLAVGALVAIYAAATRNTREYDRAVQAHTDTLTGNTKALYEQGAALGDLVNSLGQANYTYLADLIHQNKELADAINATGMSRGYVISAIMGEEAAYENLIETLEEQWEAYRGNGRELTKQRDLRDEVMRFARDQRGLISDANDAWYEYQKSLGGANALIADYVKLMQETGPKDQTRIMHLRRMIQGTEGYKDALSDLPPELRDLVGGLEDAEDAAGDLNDEMDELNAIGKAFQTVVQQMLSPLNTYTTALERNQAATRVWAESTYKDAENASELIQEAIDGVTVSLEDWNISMEESIEAHRTFMDNIAIITDRGGQDVIASLMEMGEAGPAMAALLAEAEEGEFRRTLDNLSYFAGMASDDVAMEFQNMAQASTDAVIDGMREANREFLLGMQMMNMSAASGMDLTAQTIADKLNTSVQEAARIALRYGIVLADGINPLLEGLGTERINVARMAPATGPKIAANSGGFIPGSGPDRDTIPAMLTAGEYVLKRDTVKRLDLQSLHRFNATGDPTSLLRGYNQGGFASIEDVPAVPDFSSYGTMVGRGGRDTSEKARKETVKWLEENLAPPLSEGVGWQAMWAAVQKQFGGAVRLHSGFRPGAITATGRPSYHGMGRAIDITPSMAIFDWIVKNYRNSREIIFSPAGQRQIHNGRNHMYSGITRAMHWDHIHWAMAQGGIVDGPTRILAGEAGPEAIIPLDKLPALMGRALNLGALVNPIRQFYTVVSQSADVIAGAMGDARPGAPSPGSRPHPGSGIPAMPIFGDIGSIVSDISSLISAQKALEESHQNLVDARQRVKDLQEEYMHLVRAMEQARREGKDVNLILMTPEQELAIINARQNVAKLRDELAQMRKGPGLAEELAVLQQRQTVSRLVQELKEMRNRQADPAAIKRAEEQVTSAQLKYNEAATSMSEAQAKLAGAQFEVARSAGQAAALRASGNEVQALLVEYQAAYQLAEANREVTTASEELKATQDALKQAQQELTEARKVDMPTADELRMKEIELALARERLTEVQKAGTYTTEELRAKELELIIATERLTEAQEAVQKPSDRLREIQDELRQAHVGVEDAEWGVVEASMRLIDAQQRMAEATPSQIALFREMAKAAGMSADQINRIVGGIHAIQVSNPVVAAARASGAQYFSDGSRHLLRTSWGEWFLATGGGQIAGLQKLFGAPSMVPQHHIGPVAGAVQDLFGGPGGIEQVIAGTRPLPRLALGGIIRRAGHVLVGDGGEPEIVDLPSGARVTPLSAVDKSSGNTLIVKEGAVQITFEGSVGQGAAEEIKEAVEEALEEFKKNFLDGWDTN